MARRDLLIKESRPTPSIRTLAAPCQRAAPRQVSRLSVSPSRLLFKSDHLISNSIRRQIDSKEAQREFLPTQCARTRRTSSGKPAISGSGIARRIQREYLRADGHRLDHDWRDRPRGRQCIGCELCRSESSRNSGWFELPGGRFEGQSRVDCLAHKGIV